MVEVLFILIISIIIMLLMIPNGNINNKQGKYLLIGGVTVIAICAAMIVPKANFDLARHYKDYYIIRHSSMNLWEYVFNSSRITDANYRYMYFYNLINYAVSKFMAKESIPFISMVVCYGVWGYILLDYKKQNRLPNFYVALSILVLNSLMPILYVYSNVRNEVAVAVMALGLYLRIYKKINIFVFAGLTLLAGTMHPIVLIVIPFVFLANIRPGKKGIILVAVIPIALSWGSEKFIKSSNQFFRYIGFKFYNYTYVTEYSQGSFFFYTAIIFTAFILLLSVLRRNIRTQNVADYRFLNFLSWYCIFTLANFQSYQIVMRLPYILGVLSPIIVNVAFKIENYKGYKKLVIVFGMILLILISFYALYVNYAWMR